jgi:hypothetical protein
MQQWSTVHWLPRKRTEDNDANGLRDREGSHKQLV